LTAAPRSRDVLAHNPGGGVNIDELDMHRPALLAHCYRMLGSPFDAEDAVQDTLVKAMHAADGFEGRASAQTWLLRIATNVCIDAIRQRGRRRERPMVAAPGCPDGPLDTRPPEDWIEPVPDAWLGATPVDPHAAVEARETVRLAFVAALQHLPPRQRAAHLLMRVCDWSASDVADALETSVASVNSAAQRARATLAKLETPTEPAASESTVPAPVAAERDAPASDMGALDTVVDAYAKAFEAWDVEALAALLTDDVAFNMPPIALWLRGPDAVRAFLRTTGAACEGSRLVPIRANGGPGFVQYKADGHAWGVVTLELQGGRIAGITTFLDVERVVPLFGAPLVLDACAE